MTAPDETMTAINSAMALARQGDSDTARSHLTDLWEVVGAAGDPLHRCTIAHFLADLFDDAAEGLTWDVRALDAADALTDERAQAHHPSLSVAGFYPSLHLNLADNYRRLGSFDAARRHLDAARSRLHLLADDGYGTTIRTIVAEVETAVAERSTVRRASH